MQPTTNSQPSSSLSTSLQNSVLLPNGKINITQLENEIIQDISNDALYHAQDEMKKRAVQTSKDYDEFKNFVACSQLKPVQSKQMGQLFVQRGVGNYSRNGLVGAATASSRSSNKMCKVQDRNEKRLAVLMNDIQIGKRDDDVSSTHSGNNATRDDTKRNEEEFKIQNSSKNTSILMEDILKLNQVRHSNEKKSKAKKSTKSSTKNQKRIKTNVPRNAMELEREWKQYCDSPLNTLRYISLSKDVGAMNITEVWTKSNFDISTFQLPKDLRIEPESIPKSIFKIEINQTILDDIIQALELLLCHTSCKDDTTEENNEIQILRFVNRWMEAMSQCGRFSLTVEFLDEKQKQRISLVLKTVSSRVDYFLSLRPDNDITVDIALQLRRSIGTLRSLYRVM